MFYNMETGNTFKFKKNTIDVYLVHELMLHSLACLLNKTTSLYKHSMPCSVTRWRQSGPERGAAQAVQVDHGHHVAEPGRTQ